MPLAADPDSGFERQRAELRTVLESALFTRSPNLSRMLAWICERYFCRDTAAIKEYNIAVEALGRSPEFDPARDSIVRVQGTRLRKRLQQYYATEGATHEVEIGLADSGYVPQFLERLPQPEPVAVQPASEQPEPRESLLIAVPVVAASKPFHWRLWLPLAAVAVLTVVFVGLSQQRGSVSALSVSTPVTSAETPAVAAAPPAEIRLMAGSSVAKYIDAAGRNWSGDRYFEGGTATTAPDRRLYRTLDPALYKAAREGKFRYDVPLPEGTYELHLHFSEIQPSEISLESGRDGTRVFDVLANGKPLLEGFDIVSDAAGTNIADERVFGDLTPAKDGMLHLEFLPRTGSALLNALELVPVPPGTTRPIRLLTGARMVYDANQQLWTADRWFLGGRVARFWPHQMSASEPGLYAGVRWGHFSYAIPVAEGSYTLTLKFMESNYGSGRWQRGGPGSRVFNVYCNGKTLLENFDILREAPAALHGLDKTFRGLKPSAQGKLMLLFTPVRDYAIVSAIEVVPERNGAGRRAR